MLGPDGFDIIVIVFDNVAREEFCDLHVKLGSGVSDVGQVVDLFL